jgi:hypothetical protein
MTPLLKLLRSYRPSGRVAIDPADYQKIPDEGLSSPQQCETADVAIRLKRWCYVKLPVVYVFTFLAWTILIFHVGTYHPALARCNNIVTTWCKLLRRH